MAVFLGCWSVEFETTVGDPVIAVWFPNRTCQSLVHQQTPSAGKSVDVSFRLKRPLLKHERKLKRGIMLSMGPRWRIF